MASPETAAPPRAHRTAFQNLELTSRGKVVAGLLALAVTAAWLTGDPHSRLAASLLVAPLLIDLIGKGRRLGDLEIELPPRRTVAGMPFVEHLRVHNPSYRRTYRDVVLTEPRTATLQGGSILEALGPRETCTVPLPSRSRQRSHMLERVFHLTATWPFGLLCTTAVIKCPAPMVTEPARLELPPHLLQAAAEGTPAHNVHERLSGREFHSLREHQPDEDARRVHALRSAATGTLVSRVDRGHQPREVALVLDLRRPPGRHVNLGQQRLEWSLSACASLVDHAQRFQLTAHCLIIGNEEHLFQRVAEPGHASEVLTWLAEAVAVRHRPIPPDLLERLNHCEACYWIPAGGYVAREELSPLPHEVLILGMEDL